MSDVTTTTIWDPIAGKTRLVRNLHVVLYDSGAVVEFQVVGENREWPMFLPLDKFRDMNPSIVLKE
jgi:hypothetical protein